MLYPDWRCPEPPIDPPEPEPLPHCPICGEECEMWFRDRRSGDVVGCERCVHIEYAYRDE